MRNIIKFIKSFLGIKPSTDSQKDRIEEGIKKIYEGASKLLDKNSREYKEVDEKNEEAWKKLAEL